MQFDSNSSVCCAKHLICAQRVMLSLKEKGRAAALRVQEADRNPSDGGWPGYPVWYRELICRTDKHSLPPGLERSRQRWMKMKKETGSYDPKPHRGGPKPRMTAGEVLLVYLFKLAHPYASGDEVIVFLAETVGEFYTRPRISDVITKVLDLTFKRTRAIASERSEVRVSLWHLKAPPVGHVGVARGLLVNIDEAGLYFDVTTRSWGHAPRGETPEVRARMARGLRMNVIAGITANGELYIQISKENTDEDVFLAFLDEQVFPANVGRPRVLMWDNLRVHLTPTVLAACARAGHTVLPCCPYNPEDAPVEYFFGRMEENLKKLAFETTPANFEVMIRRAATNASSEACMRGTFAHCGL